MKISRGLIGTALGITLSALLLSPPVAQADVVTDANARAAEVASRIPAPPPAVRTMAIVQVSVFEAVNAVTGDYEPYLATPTAASASGCPPARCSISTTFFPSI